jgi:hypothetical protein
MTVLLVNPSVSYFSFCYIVFLLQIVFLVYILSLCLVIIVLVCVYVLYIEVV